MVGFYRDNAGDEPVRNAELKDLILKPNVSSYPFISSGAEILALRMMRERMMMEGNNWNDSVGVEITWMMMRMENFTLKKLDNKLNNCIKLSSDYIYCQMIVIIITKFRWIYIWKENDQIIKCQKII